MVPELKVDKGEKQVSDPLVISCTQMPAHALDIMCVWITRIVIAYIYIHIIYIIKYN